MFRYVRPIVVLATCVFGPALGALAQTPLPDRVEEDWALVIDTPDTTANGPQITTTMSAFGDNTAGPYPAFDMNYREYPSYGPGGMQVQVWSGESLVGLSTKGRSQLNTPGETITWTQAMSIDGSGTVTYSIKSGVSTTWGAFGQGNALNSVSFSTSLTSLAAYSPGVSIANSGATWQSNHVMSLAVVQVRYYSNGSLILTDTTRRDVALPY
jgi:hypothetical protein